MEPEIGPLSFYVQCFFELSTSRQSGLGVAPISFEQIYKFAIINELEDYHSFNYLIRVLDGCYLKFHSEKQKAKQNASTNRSQGNTDRGKVVGARRNKKIK